MAMVDGLADHVEVGYGARHRLRQPKLGSDHDNSNMLRILKPKAITTFFNLLQSFLKRWPETELIARVD